MALESSLKMSPVKSRRLLLGRVYLQLKDAKNAADQFEAGLLVDSSNSEGRLGLAKLKFSNPILPAPLPDLEAFTKTDLETLKPCVCSREPIEALVKNRRPSELSSRRKALKIVVESWMSSG